MENTTNFTLLPVEATIGGRGRALMSAAESCMHLFRTFTPFKLPEKRKREVRKENEVGKIV